MRILKTAILVSALALSSATHAALVERLGGLAYYDTNTDLTWLADASASVGLDWAGAKAWAANLDVDGVTGWRLPYTIDVNNDGPTYTVIHQGVDFGYNITTHSELSNMFFNVLGNLSYYDTSGAYQIGSGLQNKGPFNFLQGVSYWSATEYAPNTAGSAWTFNYGYGDQRGGAKETPLHAWAVHDGDVVAVPIPAAAWLFSSALLGLGALKRRKA